MHPLSFDHLKSNFQLLTHPGGNRPPVCEKLERLYQETKADGELEVYLQATIFLGATSKVLNGPKDIVISQTAADVHMTRRIQANGLIVQKGHPLRGFWVHSIGSGVFLLARPNENARTGVRQSFIPPSELDPSHLAWKATEAFLEKHERTEGFELVLNPHLL